MRPPMNGQVGTVLEDFAAKLTSVIASSAGEIFSGLRVKQSIETALGCNGL